MEAEESRKKREPPVVFGQNGCPPIRNGLQLSLSLLFSGASVFDQKSTGSSVALHYNKVPIAERTEGAHGLRELCIYGWRRRSLWAIPVFIGSSSSTGCDCAAYRLRPPCLKHEISPLRVTSRSSALDSEQPCTASCSFHWLVCLVDQLASIRA